MENLITITGINYYMGMNAFKVGRVLRIEKEPDNNNDSEAIRVLLPVIGTVGYVANSVNTVYGGTQSAGRLYNDFGAYAYAKVIVLTHSGVIAQVLPQDVNPKYDAIYNVGGIDEE